MCFKSIWHSTGNAFNGCVCMFQERLAFCEKCLLSSFLIFFKSVSVFMENAIDRPEFMFQELLAFCGKCLLSSFVMCVKSVWHFAGKMPIIVVCNVFQGRLAFYGKYH